eukprot:8249387-Pyramimonas_sp.AAC.1
MRRGRIAPPGRCEFTPRRCEFNSQARDAIKSKAKVVSKGAQDKLKEGKDMCSKASTAISKKFERVEPAETAERGRQRASGEFTAGCGEST